MRPYGARRRVVVANGSRHTTAGVAETKCARKRARRLELVVDETMKEIREEIDRCADFEADEEEWFEFEAALWWASSEHGVPAWEATADMIMVHGLGDSSEAS